MISVWQLRLWEQGWKAQRGPVVGRPYCCGQLSLQPFGWNGLNDPSQRKIEALLCETEKLGARWAIAANALCTFDRDHSGVSP